MPPTLAQGGLWLSLPLALLQVSVLRNSFLSYYTHVLGVDVYKGQCPKGKFSCAL
jgi:hypothetical protein